MHKNYFDIVIAHIEENITQTTEEIKKEAALWNSKRREL